MNKIIAIVGMCGSGKSVVCDYYESLGFTKIYFGGVTLDKIKEEGLEINEKNEKYMREKLRKEYGMSAYAIILLPKIEESLKKGNVVLDGLYSWDELKVLKDLMFEFIYYRHIWIDKLDRVYTMPRDVVLLTDTDSCIVSLDEWYRTILEWTIGVPMEIKYTREEIEKEMDKIILHKRKTEPIKEYDFYNQELVDAKRLKYPAVIIEEDNLRYSIVNILSYILSDIILDYMYLFGENYNAQTDNRECLLIMKNEFLFKSMFITNGKKNYADLQVLQEGNIIPEDKQLDVKGMPISKVGIPESTSQRLMDILEYDILRESFVDQVDLIRKFVVLEKDIIKSLKA